MASSPRPVSSFRLPQDPWAPRGDEGRNLHLLEPFERERADAAEYVAAKVSDAESQTAALFARIQAHEELKAEGALSAADGLAQEIATLGRDLQKTIREALQSLRPVPRVLQAADLQLRLRLLLAVDRVELWAGPNEASGLLLAKHRALLGRRSIEPIFSYVAELTRLLEAMLPIRDAEMHFLGGGQSELADERAAELAQAEDVLVRTFDAAASKVEAFAPHETAEHTAARIQLLLLGRAATEHHRMALLERTVSRVVALSTPPRTWPFPPIDSIDATDETLAQAVLARSRMPLDAGRSSVRRMLLERFWSHGRTTDASSAVTDAVDSLAGFLDLVDLSNVDRLRTSGLLRALSSGAVTSMDLRAAILLARLDDRRLRFLARGYLVRPNSPLDGARLSLVAHILILLGLTMNSRSRWPLGSRVDGGASSALESSAASASSTGAAVFRTRI